MANCKLARVVSSGMRTLKMDGMEKVLMGLTDQIRLHQVTKMSVNFRPPAKKSNFIVSIVKKFMF